MPSQTRLTDGLLSRVSGIRDTAWNADVLRRTELCLLDSLSCFSAGMALEHFQPSAAIVDRTYGGSGAVGTTGNGPSAFTRAYLYGQAANSLDYDDTLIGHPGAPVIGAVLSAASRDHLSIDSVLRGIASGYEVHGVLSTAAFPSSDQAALVRSVGVWDTVAASIGVCVALGADDSMMERVIGVAASHSLLPYTAKWYERPVSAVKNNLGWAAAGAVLSVDLVASGQTGLTNVLEGASGMWRMAGSDQWRSSEELGAKQAVMRVGFKQFPACWHLQEYLKSLSGLLLKVPSDDEITGVAVTGPKAVEKFSTLDISGPADIAFSLPATLSLLISGVEPGPAWDSLAERPKALRYGSLYRFSLSEKRSITLTTRGGLKLETTVDESDFLDPAEWGLTEVDVVAKHQRLTDPELLAGAAKALAPKGSPSRKRSPDLLYEAYGRLMVGERSSGPDGTMGPSIRN